MKRAAIVVFFSVCAAVGASSDASTARRAILDPTVLRPVGGPIVGVRSDGERFVVLRYERPRDDKGFYYPNKVIDTWTGRHSSLNREQECMLGGISGQTTTLTAGRALISCTRNEQRLDIVRDLATGQETVLPATPTVDGQTVDLRGLFGVLGRRWVEGRSDCPARTDPRGSCSYFFDLQTGEIRFVRAPPIGSRQFLDLDDPALPLRRPCSPGADYDENSRQYAPPFYISKNGLARCPDGRVVQPMRGYWSGSDLSGGFLSWGYGDSGYDGQVARGTDRVYVYNIARKRLYAWTLPRRDRRKNVKGPVGHPIRTLCTLYVAVTRGFTEDGIVNRIRLYAAPMPPPRDPRCTSR